MGSVVAPFPMISMVVISSAQGVDAPVDNLSATWGSTGAGFGSLGARSHASSGHTQARNVPAPRLSSHDTTCPQCPPHLLLLLEML